MKVKYCLVDAYRQPDTGNVLLEDNQDPCFRIESEDLKILGKRYFVTTTEREIVQRISSMGIVRVEHTMYIHLRPMVERV